MLGGVPFGQRGETWVWFLLGSPIGAGMPWIFPSSILGGRGGCAGALLQPMLWVLVLRRSPSPCCWRWTLQGHTSHLPQHRGGHITHSCHCPHRCGRGCSTPVNHLLSLCLEPHTLNLLEAWCSKRATLSSGQRLKAPLDLLFHFPSGAFLPIRCLLLVWEQPGLCGCPWCGWWADEESR